MSRLSENELKMSNSASGLLERVKATWTMILILASLAACGGPSVELRPPVPYDPGAARMVYASEAESQRGDYFVVHADGRSVPIQLATSDARGRTGPGCQAAAAVRVVTWDDGGPDGVHGGAETWIDASTDEVAHVAAEWVAVQMSPGVCLRTWQLQPGDVPGDQWWVTGDGSGEPSNMASGGGSPQCPPRGCAWQATIWPPAPVSVLRDVTSVRLVSDDETPSECERRIWRDACSKSACEDHGRRKAVERRIECACHGRCGPDRVALSGSGYSTIGFAPAEPTSGTSVSCPVRASADECPVKWTIVKKIPGDRTLCISSKVRRVTLCECAQRAVQEKQRYFTWFLSPLIGRPTRGRILDSMYVKAASRKEEKE